MKTAHAIFLDLSALRCKAMGFLLQCHLHYYILSSVFCPLLSRTIRYMYVYLLTSTLHPPPPSPGPSFHILYLSSLVPHPSPFTPHHSYLLLTQSNIYIFVNYCRSFYCENYTLSRYGPIDWLIIMLIKTFHAVQISIDSTQPCGPFLLVIFQEQFVKNVACKTSEKLWQSIKIFYSKPSGKNA